MSRDCDASLSAEDYRRTTSKDRFDPERWQWLDAGHERCPEPAVVTRRSLDVGDGDVHLCLTHGRGTTRYPIYLTPGPRCWMTCCHPGDPDLTYPERERITAALSLDTRAKGQATQTSAYGWVVALPDGRMVPVADRAAADTFMRAQGATRYEDADGSGGALVLPEPEPGAQEWSVGILTPASHTEDTPDEAMTPKAPAPGSSRPYTPQSDPEGAQP